MEQKDGEKRKYTHELDNQSTERKDGPGKVSRGTGGEMGTQITMDFN